MNSSQNSSQNSAAQALATLEALAQQSRAAHSARFFKTGPGEYGEGDVFWGIPVPRIRDVARQYRDLPSGEVSVLFAHPVHEVRVLAVVIITNQFGRLRGAAEREAAFDFYVNAVRAGYVNNWDLIDISAPTFGAFLVDQVRTTASDASGERLLRALAVAESMWERRLAVLLTFAFIRVGEFGYTLELAATLLGDKQDLMHKAVGWMLREVGKRDVDVLRAFLEEHVRQMPRTTLRYAIEKFDEVERKAWLRK